MPPQRPLRKSEKKHAPLQALKQSRLQQQHRDTLVDKLVVQHLLDVGIDKDFVKQLKNAFARKVRINVKSYPHRFPMTMIDKIYKYAHTGTFDVEVYGLGGYLGSVEASAGMTIPELAEVVKQLTGIPVSQQRLIHNTRELKSQWFNQICGVTPLLNKITVLRTTECLANPSFSLQTLMELLPDRRFPAHANGWAAVQDIVWPGYPRLRDDWVRVLARSNLMTYFYNRRTGRSTRDYNEARIQED